jgi:hypothetical protein
MAQYKEGPIGPFVHAHVNEPDKGNDKFKPRAPEFKVDQKVSLSDPLAAALKEALDRGAEEAMEAYKVKVDYDSMKGKARKEIDEEFKLYVPYELEEDDDGEPTGNIIFNFRQNQIIKLRDNKGTKTIEIGIYDAEGEEMDKQVRPGAEGRVMYSIRHIPMPGLKKVGVRLDFSMVQITKLSTSGGSGGGSKFGSVAGGYVDDGVKEERPAQPEGDNSEADY